MEEMKKFARIEKAAGFAPDMAKINLQALRELGEDEVFAFRIAAADDQVDRDMERFTPAALEGLAKLFVGKTVIMDHQWSAHNQTARIYDGYTEQTDSGVTRLILCAYMLRSDATADAVNAIEGGILREVSVGCAMGKATCSICGTDLTERWCDHEVGMEYDSKLCVVLLEDPIDAYELSFVAVPAQRQAGVVKQYGGEGNRPKETPPESGETIVKALALLELEEKRFI